MAFIGREAELGMLADALQRAAEGEASRVVLRGPLGIGISRLLDELTSRLADAPGVIVCRGRAEAPSAGQPYAPLARALAPAVASVDDEQLADLLGPAAYDMSALLPGLGERMAALGAAPRPPALQAPNQRGARVQEAVLGVIERLAGDGVVCLVLEDLQHADPGTHEFVEALLRVSRRLPLALIVSYHTDDVSRGQPAWDFVRRLTEHRAVETMTLAPMARDDLLALVEAARDERPSLSFTAAIMEGSRGNPLIATQLVAAHGQVAGLRLSDPFTEIVHARLALLAAPVRRVLRLLAAARRPLARQALLDAPLPDGHIARPVLAAAIESGFTVRRDEGIEIVHQLVAEAIEELVLPGERQLLHAALAATLVDDPAEQAWHWELALRPAEARAAHLAAADAAARLEPGRTALLHYQRALELTEGKAGAEPAAGLTDDTTAVLAAAAAAAEAGGLFRRAAALAEQAIERRSGGRVERLLSATGGRDGDRRATERAEVGLLVERLGSYRRDGGDLEGAQRALEQAVSLMPEGPTAARAQALASLAQHLMIGGDFAASAPLAEQAREIALAVGPEGAAVAGHATCTLGVDVAYLGDLQRGLALLEEATELSRQAGRLDDVMRAYANRTTLLDLDTRREAALAVVSAGIAEAGRNGLGLTYGAFLRGNAADILFQLGRWEESERECRAAMEFPPAGVAWFTPLLYLGLLLVESRADDEAARLVGRTLLELESVPAGQWTSLVLRAAVSLALWRGEVDDARRVAASEWERVLATADAAQIATAAATVLEACAASAEAGRERRDWGAVAEAGELAARVLPDAEREVATGDLPANLGARREAELYLASARAHEARIRGRSKAAEWRRLAEAWAELPVPYQAAKAHWWHAEAALEARDRRPEARAALHAAWRLSGELPARPLRRALAELAARGRISLPDDGPVVIPIRPAEKLRVAVGPGKVIAERLNVQPAPVTSASFGLSPRENSVLMLLAEGLTNREIGERLFIRQATVAVHVRKVLSKLGVSNRIEATGLAIRLGLVPEEAVAPRFAGTAARR
jgi:DNA-binding CsgD family transcriptional regulator/tetratricopeptide (TPR) repeat protein